VISRLYRVVDASGLHARPAAEFVKAAAAYPGQVRIRRGPNTANAKSILQVMGVGARTGDTVTVEFDGDDTAAVDLFEARLVDILKPE